MNPETRPLFLRCTADGKRFLMTTNSEASEGESAPATVVLKWAAGLKNQARRHGERPTCNSPPGHFLVKLRRSRRQVSARRKLHRAVDAQVATANSIPWSSTAKFSRNGVLVAPLRVTRHSEKAEAKRTERDQERETRESLGMHLGEKWPCCSHGSRIKRAGAGYRINFVWANCELQMGVAAGRREA